MNYQILTPLIPFTLGIILKTILDFNLAFFIVKYFYWVPVRWLFRQNLKIFQVTGNSYGKTLFLKNIKGLLEEKAV